MTRASAAAIVDIIRACGPGSYGRQTVGDCPRKPRSGEHSYGLGDCLPAIVALMIWPACCAAAELRTDLQWKQAAPAPISAHRANLPAGPSLEEIVADAGKQPGGKAGSESSKTSKAVVEGELFPLRYRRIIRRYFELIQGQR